MNGQGKGLYTIREGTHEGARYRAIPFERVLMKGQGKGLYTIREGTHEGAR